MRRLALLIFVLSLFAVPATANAAVAGGLKQLSGTNGCLSGDDPLPATCRGIRALTGVTDLVVSPDGKNAYASAPSLDAVVAFDRNATSGVLTQKSTITGCITSNGTTATNMGCNLVANPDSLDGVGPLAISPDGTNLYSVNQGATTATNNGIITVLNRGADGTLSFNEVNMCCFGSGAAVAITVSGDGRSVYAVGPWFNGMVEWLRRTTDAGANHGDIQNGAFYQGPSAAIQNLGNSPNDVVVTPDGKEVIISTGNGTQSILGWDRNTGGTPADHGRLTPATATNRCVTGSGTGSPAGTCQNRQGILSPQSLAVGNSVVYVGSQQSLSTISRNASNNALTPDTAGNCFGYPTSTFAGCTPMPGTSPFVWYPARALGSTPDGKSLYFGTEATPAGIFGYNRSGNNISRNVSAGGCVNTGPSEGCRAFRDGNRIQQLVVAPGSRHVYAVGNNRLFSFEIDRPPVCSNLSVSTGFQSATSVGLSCSDPDGDALTYEANQPARGRVGVPQGNAVTYDPFSNTTGADSFTYRARAAGVNSDLATVSVNVGGPPPPPPPPPPGGGNTADLIPSTVTNNWLAFPKFTKVTNLSVNNLLAGTTVRVTCKTKGKSKKKQKKGCPYRSKRFTTSGARAKLNLLKPFRKKRMPIGTRIQITVTVPGEIGKRFRYTMRKRKIPGKQLRCIPPGGKISTCS